MADAEDIQPLVCDNGTGMVKVILHMICSYYMCWFFSGDNFNFTLLQNLDMSWKLTKRNIMQTPANSEEQWGRSSLGIFFVYLKGIVHPILLFCGFMLEHLPQGILKSEFLK